MIFIRILISSWVAGEKFQRYLLWLSSVFVRFPPKNTEYFSVLKFKPHWPVKYRSADTWETSFTLAAAVWMGTSRYEVAGKAEKPERCQEKLYAAACLGGVPVLLMGGGAHIESPPRCQQWWQYWINNKNFIEGDEDHDDVVLNSSHSNEDVTRMNFIHWCEKRCTVYNAKPPKNRLYTQIVWQADGKLWLSSSGCNPLWGAWKRSRPGRHQGWAPESRDLLKN